VSLCKSIYRPWPARGQKAAPRKSVVRIGAGSIWLLPLVAAPRRTPGRRVGLLDRKNLGSRKTLFDTATLALLLLLQCCAAPTTRERLQVPHARSTGRSTLQPREQPCSLRVPALEEGHLVMMAVGLFRTLRTRGRTEVPPAFTSRRGRTKPNLAGTSTRGSQTSIGAVLLEHDRTDTRSRAWSTAALV
jgi:hypothetical protein